MEMYGVVTCSTRSDRTLATFGAPGIATNGAIGRLRYLPHLRCTEPSRRSAKALGRPFGPAGSLEVSNTTSVTSKTLRNFGETRTMQSLLTRE